MRIAFISDELPVPGVAGHLAYNHAVLAWLAGRGVGVVVVLVGMRFASPAVEYGSFTVVGPHCRGVGGRVVVASGWGLARVAGRLVKRLVRRPRNGVVLGDLCRPGDAAWVARWVRNAGVDAVLVDTVFRTPVLAGLPGVNTVLLAHDVFHLRAAQAVALGLAVRPAGFDAAAEAALAARAAHIAAIQPEEAAVLARMCPAADVFTAPMPAVACPPPARVAARRLVFLGSATPANLTALRWFLADIWTLLTGVTLVIAGDVGGAVGALPPGVSARGRVDDLAGVLHGADLAIAPLPFGSGLKIKLLDYARHGLTTVATPAAVAGFAPGGPFIVAQTAADFAAAIMLALAAPRAPEAALAYITRHYAADTCFAPLAAALAVADTPQRS